MASVLCVLHILFLASTVSGRRARMIPRAGHMGPLIGPSPGTVFISGRPVPLQHGQHIGHRAQAAPVQLGRASLPRTDLQLGELSQHQAHTDARVRSRWRSMLGRQTTTRTGRVAAAVNDQKAERSVGTSSVGMLLATFVGVCLVGSSARQANYRPRGRRRVIAARGAARSATPQIVETTGSGMQKQRTTVNTSEFFTSLSMKENAVSRFLAESTLPMPLLSTYTAAPVFSILGVALCPSPLTVARGLAGALGLISGTAFGSFIKKAKSDAARCQVMQILAKHLQASPVAEVMTSIRAARKRFGVAQGSQQGDTFDEAALCGIYKALLWKLLEAPEHDSSDLPTMQCLQGALDLDDVVVGTAHMQTAQLLVSASYSGLEGESYNVALDKLLFLSERAFADIEPEEARNFEMDRMGKFLRVSKSERRDRVAGVARTLYQQSLAVVADQVDTCTADALAGASEAFGLSGDQAAAMNTEIYRKIAADLIKGGRLSPEDKTTLERARVVLQLTEKVATTVFGRVASPFLLAEVEKAASGIKDTAAGTTADELQKIAASLAACRQELGLSASDAEQTVKTGLLGTMKVFYKAAALDARANKKESVLETLDKMIDFARTADKLLSCLRAQETNEESSEFTQTLTLDADQLVARRLYTFCLERSVTGEAAEGAVLSDELARLLELSSTDKVAASIEVCEPLLQKLYEECIEDAGADPALALQSYLMSRAKLTAKLKAFNLPPETVKGTALKVYTSLVDKVAGRVIKADEKERLEAARSFLSLTEDEVRIVHLKAFRKVYADAVDEAMGRVGTMLPASAEAIEQLRERVGLFSEDAQKIFYGVVDTRLQVMMEDVHEAWKEATYTKEALVQINKDRGKDPGEDPSADGSGADLGIKDSPVMDETRGAKLMVELRRVVDFYLGNKVLVESGGDAVYPVTVGKYMQDKTKEDVYGIFAWNAMTCMDTALKDEYMQSKPHVGGILGLDEKKMQAIVEKMVSRWFNQFIKQKVTEQGKLTDDDVSTLTVWAPQFFDIDKDIATGMVQNANKSVISAKVLRLFSLPALTLDDVQKIRDEVALWDLKLEKDFELTKPQLRALFRTEVSAWIEDAELKHDEKLDSIANSREGFGLSSEEAQTELKDLLHDRSRGCLVNAAGDLMQGKEKHSAMQMQRLEQLLSFTEGAGIETRKDWDITTSMRQALLKNYASIDTGGPAPDMKLLERTLGLQSA